MANMRLPLDYVQDIKYSVRNMSKDFATDMHSGPIYPALFEKLLAKDNFEIDFKLLLQSNPLIAPLMGQYVARVSFYECPLGNYYGWMINNRKLDTESILNRQKHHFTDSVLPVVNADNRSDQAIARKVAHNSFFDYMGIPPGYVGSTQSYYDKYSHLTKMNAERAIIYLDIIRNYYCHSQMDYIPYLTTGSISSDDDLTLQKLYYDDIDDFFDQLRVTDDGVDIETLTTSYNDGKVGSWLESLSSSGLFCAQYEPDMLVNLLQKVDSSQVGIDTSNGMFTIDTLRFKNKLQKVADRYDISGGRMSSWLKTVMGSKSHRDLPIPKLIGTTSIIIDPTNITSVSNTFNGTPDKPLGSEIGQLGGNINQFAGQGRYGKNYKFYVHVEEPSYLVALVTLVPKVYYCQGLDKDVDSVLWADDYVPEMSNLGYQPVPRHRYSVFRSVNNYSYRSSVSPDGEPNSYDLSRTVGKQVAWMDYMSNVSRSHGGMASGGDYDYFILNRRYFFVDELDDKGNIVRAYNELPSPYVNPSHWQYPFALTDLKSHNFFLQMQFSMRAVRPIGKSVMPTLD